MIPSKTVSWHTLAFFTVVLGQSFSERGSVNLVGFLSPGACKLFSYIGSNGMRAFLQIREVIGGCSKSALRSFPRVTC